MVRPVEKPEKCPLTDSLMVGVFALNCEELRVSPFIVTLGGRNPNWSGYLSGASNLLVVLFSRANIPLATLS